jgi:glutathione S-transferase
MTSVGTHSAVSKIIKPKFRYLSAWFCPFAHRATLALSHHRDRIEYEWIEALGWKEGNSGSHPDDKTAPSSSNSMNTPEHAAVTATKTLTGIQTLQSQQHYWYYHWKADELKRVNPSALVPTLVPIDQDTNIPDESRAVWESLVTVEYLDAVSGAPDADRLIPQSDPYIVALCRIWADKVNRECCSPYYGVLVRQDEQERKDHFQKLVQGLENFCQQLTKNRHHTNGSADDGTLFLGKQLSSVDVALIPWAYRYYVFETYRGPEFAISRDTHPQLEPYFLWYDTVMNMESVQRTLPDPQRYLQHIAKYADGSARSKVANAVRRGVAAHEFDDAQDDYDPTSDEHPIASSTHS